MTDRPARSDPSRDEKQVRLAAALKVNLRRRKPSPPPSTQAEPPGRVGDGADAG